MSDEWPEPRSLRVDGRCEWCDKPWVGGHRCGPSMPCVCPHVYDQHDDAGGRCMADAWNEECDCKQFVRRFPHPEEAPK